MAPGDATLGCLFAGSVGNLTTAQDVLERACIVAAQGALRSPALVCLQHFRTLGVGSESSMLLSKKRRNESDCLCNSCCQLRSTANAHSHLGHSLKCFFCVKARTIRASSSISVNTRSICSRSSFGPDGMRLLCFEGPYPRPARFV